FGALHRDDVEIVESTRRVSVRIDSGGQGLMRAMQSLDGAGLEIEDIALRQPNLDEVLLALTGHSTVQP
ncbi:MAG: daunorubicin/doxorubicin resistance ABC transporter ATP-binding protein DrrA, partial [Solirubrobacteraceae bacterium]